MPSRVPRLEVTTLPNTRYMTHTTVRSIAESADPAHPLRLPTLDFTLSTTLSPPTEAVSNLQQASLDLANRAVAGHLFTLLKEFLESPWTFGNHENREGTSSRDDARGPSRTHIEYADRWHSAVEGLTTRLCPYGSRVTISSHRHPATDPATHMVLYGTIPRDPAVEAEVLARYS